MIITLQSNFLYVIYCENIENGFEILYNNRNTHENYLLYDDREKLFDYFVSKANIFYEPSHVEPMKVEFSKAIIQRKNIKVLSRKMQDFDKPLIL